jgi:undecaprenyl-diphosphatase
VSILHVVLLAVVQGLTEFLPISSSGHLALLEQLFGWAKNEALKNAMLPFNAILHFGTLISIMAYFRSDIAVMLLPKAGAVREVGDSEESKSRAMMRQGVSHDKNRSLLLLILLANVPTGIIALLLHKHAEMATMSAYAVSAMLALTGVLLLVGERIAQDGGRLTPLRALLIGCAQGFGVMPGLSRSGVTIFAGLAVGLQRDEAVKFAFLVSIPAVIAAGLYELKEMPLGANVSIVQILIGCAIATVVGYVAIGIVMKAVGLRKLWCFALYCFLVATITLVLALKG